MNADIPINLAVEDELSEAVLRHILNHVNRPYSVGACYRPGGCGHLRRMIAGFNNAAKVTPFFVLTDLDTVPCAPELIRDWLPVPRHRNLLFRVAVREVEAWLLAHRDGFARFIGVRTLAIPQNTDEINDPKQFLLRVVSKSKRRGVRADILPKPRSTARQGPGYNSRLIRFVQETWDIDTAASQSPSLSGALEAIRSFQPAWRVA